MSNVVQEAEVLRISSTLLFILMICYMVLQPCLNKYIRRCLKCFLKEISQEVGHLVFVFTSQT